MMTDRDVIVTDHLKRAKADVVMGPDGKPHHLVWHLEITPQMRTKSTFDDTVWMARLFELQPGIVVQEMRDDNTQVYGGSAHGPFSEALRAFTSGDLHNFRLEYEAKNPPPPPLT